MSTVDQTDRCPHVQILFMKLEQTLHVCPGHCAVKSQSISISSVSKIKVAPEKYTLSIVNIILYLTVLY